MHNLASPGRQLWQMHFNRARRCRICVMGVLLLATALPCRADVLRNFTFQGLGPTPLNYGITTYLAVSDNGAVVAGGSNRNGYGEAIRWTAGTGWQTVAADNGNRASDVSADGTVMVGTASSQAFRWTEAGGVPAPLGTLPGHTVSAAEAVSRDGRFVAGYSEIAAKTGSRAIVYDSQNSQMHQLEYYARVQNAQNIAYDVASSGDTLLDSRHRRLLRQRQFG